MSLTRRLRDFVEWLLKLKIGHSCNGQDPPWEELKMKFLFSI